MFSVCPYVRGERNLVSLHHRIDLPPTVLWDRDRSRLGLVFHWKVFFICGIFQIGTKSRKKQSWKSVAEFSFRPRRKKRTESDLPGRRRPRNKLRLWGCRRRKQLLRSRRRNKRELTTSDWESNTIYLLRYYSPMECLKMKCSKWWTTTTWWSHVSTESDSSSRKLFLTQNEVHPTRNGNLHKLFLLRRLNATIYKSIN